MNIEEFRNHCLSLKGTEERMPFNKHALVFYVKGKMFCLINNVDSFDFINVKCEPQAAITLRDQYVEVTPGYHMNKQHWNSVEMNGEIPDHLIQEWVEHSYNLVVAKLPKKVQQELMG